MDRVDPPAVPPDLPARAALLLPAGLAAVRPKRGDVVLEDGRVEALEADVVERERHHCLDRIGAESGSAGTVAAAKLQGGHGVAALPVDVPQTGESDEAALAALHDPPNGRPARLLLLL